MLSGRKRVRAGLLSGGERPALAAAMASARPASMLLLDEPIAGLSQQNAGMILGIARSQREHGFATVIVEHRLN